MVSQDRWSLVTGLMALKCGIFCQVVSHGSEWSLKIGFTVSAKLGTVKIVISYFRLIHKSHTLDKWFSVKYVFFSGTYSGNF